MAGWNGLTPSAQDPGTGNAYLYEDTGALKYRGTSGSAATIINADGTTGIGVVGPTGPAGADGADGADGVGVPVGGTTGQVLAKASATDYDTEWVDQSAGIDINPLLVGAKEVATTGTKNIEVVGFSSYNAGSTSNFDVTLPTGLQAGDIVFVYVSSDGSNAGSPNEAGWTLIHVSTGTTSTVYARLYYKVMGSTPDTIVGWNEGSTVSTVVVCAAFRGFDSTAIFDVTAVEAEGSSGDPNPPSITTVTPAMVIAFGSQDDDNATLSAPTSFTLGTQITSSTTGQAAGVAYFMQTSAGTIDPAVFSTTGDDAWYAVTVALRAGLILETKEASILLDASGLTTVPSVNVVGDLTTSFNSIISTNESMQVTYYPTLGASPTGSVPLSIDGSPQTITWVGGTAPTLVGSATNRFRFTIIKTASSTYTVLGSS